MADQKDNGVSLEETGLKGEQIRFLAARRRLLLRGAALFGGLLSAGRAIAAPKVAKPAAPKAPAGWDDRFEMEVQVEIAQITGGRVLRPYVAIWVEDKEGVPVRTLGLWVQTTGRGPRWIPDLKRWYRGERLRQLSDGGDLASTVSSATKMPGSYKVLWNGKDDQGAKVAQGAYTVCVEAAREHGTYQLMRKDVVLGKQTLKADLGTNIEIKGATIDYRQRK